MTATLPDEVVRAYGIDAGSVTPITIGLVNQTFVANGSAGRIVVQRLHPVFTAAVNEDLDAITAHLAARGLETPRLVRTNEGARSIESGGTYRAITFLPGVVHAAVSSPAIAFEAGLVAGRAHHALTGFDYVFRFTRPFVHDTARHAAKLDHLLGTVDATHPVASPARAILDAIASLPPLPPTRRRILHGDLKITNVLFSPDGSSGKALLDLDTFQHGTLAVELGDALRSWCNPRGESDETAYFDPDVAKAALEGFETGAHGDVEADERASIPLGVATISFELASRFASDAIEDCYFGWDASRFESRVAHNVVRARSLLALGRDVVRRLDL